MKVKNVQREREMKEFWIYLSLKFMRKTFLEVERHLQPKIFKLSLASKKWCYNTGACKVRVIRVNRSLKRSFWFLRCCSKLNASFNSSSSLAGQNPSKASPSLKIWGKKQNETHVLIYLFQRLLFFSYPQYHDGSLSFPTELAAVILHKLLQGILTQKAVPILNKSFSYLVQGLWH